MDQNDEGTHGGLGPKWKSNFMSDSTLIQRHPIKKQHKYLTIEEWASKQSNIDGSLC